MSPPVKVTLGSTPIIGATITQGKPTGAQVIRDQPIDGASIAAAGPQGPKGDPGSTTSGPPPTGFEHIQAIPASSWTVDHNLNRIPNAVTVYDTANSVIDAGVQVLDLNSIEVYMDIPTAGRVEII